MRRSLALAMGLAAALLAAGSSPAEVRQIEAEGVVPLVAGVSREAPPRDEAVRRALGEAVRNVAMDLVPDEPWGLVHEMDTLAEAILKVDLMAFGNGDAICHNDHGRRVRKAAPSGKPGRD